MDEVIGVKMRLFESVRLGLFVADGALALGAYRGGSGVDGVVRRQAGRIGGDNGRSSDRTSLLSQVLPVWLELC